jgi:hypothetical protein
MPAPQRAKQELLQAAARLFERNLITAATGRHSLVKKAQQHRLLSGTDMAYIACIKTYYKGPKAMPRLWEDVLRTARAGGLEMSDLGQSRLTKVLANERPELAEVLAQLNASAALEGHARTALLRTAADTLVRKSEKLPPTRSLAPRPRSVPASMSLAAAVLGWVSIFDACLVPEPDPATPISRDRADIALEALDRGSGCDETYRCSTVSRARLGFPATPRVDAACGAGTWVAGRAVLAMAEQSDDPLTVARAWAVDHDAWLRPGDEPGMAAQIARSLFDHGRTADALRALEQACHRGDPIPAPGLVDVGIDLCTALLALGDRESAGRAIPPVIRALLDSPDWIHQAGSDFDEALPEALRQALVDPRLGLTALRRVWFAGYRDEPVASPTGWLVAGALARCLRESGTPEEAGTVAVLSRRLLDEPGNEQDSRMRAALVAAQAVEAEPPLEAERQRLHSLLDEFEGLLLRSPQLAADPRIVRELAGITRVARRARVLVRPDRMTRV